MAETNLRQANAKARVVGVISEKDLKIVTEDGKILLSTTTSSFPIQGDYAGITSSKGIITMTYSYEVVVTPATETTPAVTEKRYNSFTREVTFLEE